MEIISFMEPGGWREIFLPCLFFSNFFVCYSLMHCVYRQDANRQLQRFVASIMSLLQELDRCRDSPLDRENAEFLLLRLGGAMRHMHQVITFVETSPEFSQNDVNNLRQLSRELSLIEDLFRALPVFTPSSYRAPVRYTGAVGRPSYEISREQIMLLRSCYFSWTSIASILGVSRWTIHRRVIDRDIPPSFLTYSPIQQVELQQIVQEELVSMPRCGERYMQGALRRRGICVQRWRVRDALISLDPIGRACRWAQQIPRRPYRVPHPNFLWHIDSNLKLRHWRFVIHGGIDGYSRLIVYLRCSNNNRASTVLTLFRESINTWGLPSRVRADDGGENIAVGDLMIQYRGEGRGSFITGPSVHNTRIERLWREVVHCILYIFKDIFLHMEQVGILTRNNDIDLFALHYVYTPRINSALAQFIETFNNHGLSTEHSHSPHQLWVSGILQHHSSNYSGVRGIMDDSLPDDLVMYGDDPDAPLPQGEELSGVDVAPISLNVPEHVIMVLQESFHPEEEDGNQGINIYFQVRQFLVLYFGSTI